MPDTFTTTKDLIVPEVWADATQAEFLKQTRLLNSPVVRSDNTLVGRPGTTIYFPKWSKIGEMEEVAEEEAPSIDKLTHTQTVAEIKGVGKAYGWTDEATQDGIGDPQTEGTRQFGIRYAQKLDEDLFATAFEVVTAKGTGNRKTEKSEPLTFEEKTATQFSWELFVDAVATVGESWDPAQWANLFIRSEAQAALMKDPQFINAASLGAATPVTTGMIGSIGGVNIIVSNGLPENTAMLAKPGSLGCLYKQLPTIEFERKQGTRQNIAWFHSRYATKRLDDRGILKITHKAPGPGA